MRRETAYKLAGRKHDNGAHHAVSGVAKTREIRFKDFPPGQAAQAWRSLAALRGVRVEAGPDELTLIVHYNVLDFTLRLLDEALTNAGFHLDRSLLIRLHRALIYYVEDTQVHNLRSPERLIKQSHEVYIQAYAHHLHGDRDETPPELREFK
ncbi:hypothetical protein [Zoogloea sp.]|jgi:hypothetical protein|uniref:hypothetical protein n=1 Tax=Zoogloea sp. TaxID=49181 RepID=UPI0035B1C92A